MMTAYSRKGTHSPGRRSSRRRARIRRISERGRVLQVGRFCQDSRHRAHASSLFIPTTRLWAALKSRLLLNQAGFGSHNLSEVSSKHRITDLYAWTLEPSPDPLNLPKSTSSVFLT